MEIRIATTDDLAAIHCWLEETESGFLGNWNLIEKGAESGNLSVVVDDADIIAFCLSSSSSMDILEVREDRRNRGIGRQLANFVLTNARNSESLGVTGFCEPSNSLGFWIKVGFEHVADPNQEYKVAYPFRRQHELPEELERCRLDFVLYSYSYTDEKPYREASVIAVIEHDGTYSLTEDFLEYAAWPDMRLTIHRDGEALYDGKCKYVEDVGGERKCPWVLVRYLEPDLTSTT